MGSRISPGSTYLFTPRPGQPGGLVDMTMQSDAWLLFFYEPADGDATSMYIQRDMVNCLAIQGYPVQGGLMRGRMKKENRFG